MNPIPVNLAVEDQLSEAVVRKILASTERGYAIGTVYGRGGFGYLRSTAHGWNRAAAGIPFILLTDLDQYPCPRALIGDWLRVPRHHNLLIRVAVREVESWLLADRSNFADFLAVARKRVPEDVDGLADPKAALISLARMSRLRDIRERIAPKPGSTARVGPDYNGCLIEFVVSGWDIDAAAEGSPSLARTVDRFRTFTPRWPPTR